MLGGGFIRWLSFGSVLSLVPTKMARKKLVEVQLVVMTSQVGNNKLSRTTTLVKKLIFFSQITTQIVENNNFDIIVFWCPWFDELAILLTVVSIT